MTNPHPVNFAASAYAKLKNIADRKKWNFMHLLIRYGIERFFYRLSVSPHADQFVLKGGNLFVIWQRGNNSRPTIDSDMLCFGNADPEYLRSVFTKAALSVESPEDGMRYDEKSIEISPIREETEYGGTRVLLYGYLGTARIRLQFDIGVGDAITPSPELTDFPVLLNGPVPRLKAYPMATTIAEKSEVMVSRGLLNSRLKDFYDIWLLSELFDHDYKILRLAVQNTFTRRHVPMPENIPDAWTPEFAASPMKAAQWTAFLRKNKMVNAPADFRIVGAKIAAFLIPVFFPPQESPVIWKASDGWR